MSHNSYNSDHDPAKEFEDFLKGLQPNAESGRTAANPIPSEPIVSVAPPPPARPRESFERAEVQRMAEINPLATSEDLPNLFSPPPPPERPALPTQQRNPDPNLTLTPSVIARDEGICPHCRAPRHDDNNFCYNCGIALIKQNLQNCRQCQTPLVPHANFCYNCGKSVEPVPELIITITENGQNIVLRGEQLVYTIGREVPEQNNFVDIDLGQIGQRKVSRQHARLILHELIWYLEDLGSKGGTRIFNTKLLPNQPTPLEDGMLIYFADIKCKVEIH